MPSTSIFLSSLSHCTSEQSVDFCSWTSAQLLHGCSSVDVSPACTPGTRHCAISWSVKTPSPAGLSAGVLTAQEIEQCRVPGVQVRCLVERWRNRLTRRASSKLLWQEHVTVIAAVDLHHRIDKDEVCEAKLWDADGHHNRSTKRRPGAQLIANLNFNISQMCRAVTNYGCGGIYYMGFVFPTVKEFYKKLNSYHAGKIMAHRISRQILLAINRP